LSALHGDISLQPNILLPNLLELARGTAWPPAVTFDFHRVRCRLSQPPPPTSTDTRPPSYHSCHSSHRHIHTSTSQHPNLESACSAHTESSSFFDDPHYRLHISSGVSRQQERARTSLRATCRPAPLDHHRIPKASYRCRGYICAFRQSCRSALRHICGWLAFRIRRRS